MIGKLLKHFYAKKKEPNSKFKSCAKISGIILLLPLTLPNSPSAKQNAKAQTLAPKVEQFEQKGRCAFYSDSLHGTKTASGERYNKNDFTCSRKTLPFNTLLHVTNVANGRTAVVRVIDRGPYGGKRILDVSKAAAKKLDFVRQGPWFASATRINEERTWK